MPISPAVLDLPKHLHHGVIGYALVLEVMDVKVGEAVVDVTGQGLVRAHGVLIHQLGDEVRRHADDERLEMENMAVITLNDEDLLLNLLGPWETWL